jgi:hypothetical protein
VGINNINESELINNLENNTVKKIVLRQRADMKFEIHVHVSWRGEELLQLETQRKQPRTWSSLDRLANHIMSKWPYGDATIEISLWRRQDE